MAESRQDVVSVVPRRKGIEYHVDRVWGSQQENLMAAVAESGGRTAALLEGEAEELGLHRERWVSGHLSGTCGQTAAAGLHANRATV